MADEAAMNGVEETTVPTLDESPDGANQGKSRPLFGSNRCPLLPWAAVFIVLGGSGGKYT